MTLVGTQSAVESARSPICRLCESSMSAQRILLISGTAPGEPGVGGVILRDLVQIIGISHFECCWLNPLRDQRPVYLPELSLTHYPRRYETGWRPVRGLMGEVLSYASTSLLRRQLLNQIVRSIRSQIARYQPELILTVLESATAVQVMSALLPHLPCPIRTIVWDDIETFSPAGTLDRWTRSGIARDFRRVLQASEKVAVICENMQVAYQAQYGVDSQVLRHGMPEATSTNPDESANTVWRIGFAGSITTPDCFQSLVSALDQHHWRIAGRPITLRLLGCRLQLGSRSPQSIEYLGWRDVAETRDLLGECNLLYLPQSFKPELRHLSELSFPTKLSTYIATRRPIVLQAPTYGSLTSFWRDYPLGPVIPDLTEKGILHGLESGLLASDVQLSSWRESSVRGHREQLSVHKFEQGVRELLVHD